jgi:hypothetical protein
MGLACDENVNVLGDNIDTINKMTETLTDASKEVDLEINRERENSVCAFASSPESGYKDRIRII